MTRHKVNLSLLYAGGAPAKWWKRVAAEVDGALGMLCANQWQNMRVVTVAQATRTQRRRRVR